MLIKSQSNQITKKEVNSGTPSTVRQHYQTEVVVPLHSMAIDKAGQSQNSTTRGRTRSELDIEKMAYLYYEKGLSFREIAEKCDTSISTISRRFKENNFPVRKLSTVKHVFEYC